MNGMQETETPDEKNREHALSGAHIRYTLISGAAYTVSNSVWFFILPVLLYEFGIDPPLHRPRLFISCNFFSVDGFVLSTRGKWLNNRTQMILGGLVGFSSLITLKLDYSLSLLIIVGVINSVGTRLFNNGKSVTFLQEANRDQNRFSRRFSVYVALGELPLIVSPLIGVYFIQELGAGNLFLLASLFALVSILFSAASTASGTSSAGKSSARSVSLSGLPRFLSKNGVTAIFVVSVVIGFISTLTAFLVPLFVTVRFGTNLIPLGYLYSISYAGFFASFLVGGRISDRLNPFLYWHPESW